MIPCWFGVICSNLLYIVLDLFFESRLIIMNINNIFSLLICDFLLLSSLHNFFFDLNLIDG